MTQTELSQLQVENLDHLGIVAGIIDRIGLVQRINERVGTSPDELVTSGQVLKAMILNGLGFVSAPMYLFSRFFEGKPTEHLLGEGVRPEHLNDDKLIRVLEKLSDYGLTTLFVEIALQTAELEGVRLDRLHLDGTSFSVEGRYLHEPGEKDDEEPKPIHITHGYSRDHRPDLKQFLAQMMVSSDGGVPTFFRVSDGNESEAKVFAKLIHDYQAQLNLETLFVADAALYNEENLKRLETLSYICRVPKTIERARQLLTGLQSAEFSNSRREGYRLCEVAAEYGGVEQRWIVVESENRAQRELAGLDKRIEKEHGKAGKELKALGRRSFSCEADAHKAADELARSLRYHRLENVAIEAEPYHARPGRPRKDQSPEYRYRVQAELEPDEERVSRHRQRAGRFILATNVLDAGLLDASQILESYLAQQTVERGFKFLKDPMFFTDSVFIKTPKRVAAVAMVMGLCLLVYSLGERELRLKLAASESSIPDQRGKPTKTPTLRWVFQLFQAVHLLRTGSGGRLIHGLTGEREHVLGFFGVECRRYYLLA
jgi:transposase